MTDKPRVFIGVPTYDDRINMGLPNGIYGATNHGVVGGLHFMSNSWLTRNFNRLLAQALNESNSNGITHFLLWHEDLEITTRYWLDTMLEIMAKNQADVVSVISPIKSMEGLTSTAIDEQVGDMDPHYRPRRLTMTEIYNDYPTTFTAPNLLVNTGLMLVDLKREWTQNIWFEMEDKIIRNAKTGEFMAVGVPEDWNFSRKAKKAGAKLVATREVSVVHHGRFNFTNDKPWGLLKKDR